MDEKDPHHDFTIAHEKLLMAVECLLAGAKRALEYGADPKGVDERVSRATRAVSAILRSWFPE